ncbi:MAG: DUF4430 domain-containing protein [Thermoplasmata archaeon]|nr:DUF4430 domain-containing protein [Thermoplasmata archaeon]
MEGEKVSILLLVFGIVLPIAALGAVGYVVMTDDASTGAGTDHAQEDTNTTDEAVPLTASVIIDLGNGTVLSFHNLTSDQTTVYGFLLVACGPSQGNLSVTTTYYSQYDSLLVDSIGGRSNGNGGKYWGYLVDDERPMVGADKCYVEQGDVIEWIFAEMSW